MSQELVVITGASSGIGRGIARAFAAEGNPLLLISRHIEPFDPGCLTSLGIDPASRRYLMLKSRIHYRVGFKKLWQIDSAKKVVHSFWYMED